MSDAISTNRVRTIMKTKLIVAALSFALICVFSANAQSSAPTSTFSGRAFGVGHEFENEKRVEGDMLMLGATLKF